jgi:hypothetical protein
MGVVRLFLPCGTPDVTSNDGCRNRPSTAGSSSLRSTEDGTTAALELPTLLVAVVEGFSLTCNKTESATASEDLEAAGAHIADILLVTLFQDLQGCC